jgi:hypothetical protein
MMHPHLELRYIGPTIGYGLFATKAIAAGTVTWVQDPLDGVFAKDFPNTLEPEVRKQFDRYAYRNQDGAHVLCWDKAKYINHNCNPNTLSSGFHVDITLQDIKQDQELTTDYAQLNLEESFACDCQAPQCRKEVSSHQAAQLVTQWDHKLTQALLHTLQVDQLLWPLIPNTADLKTQIQKQNIPSSAINLMPEFQA